MATLEEIRRGLGRFWDTLSQEWSQFIGRAADAITRFTPLRKDEDAPGNRELVRHSPRLGVLASEVLEGEAEITVRLEAPGMEREDFRVQVVEDTLVIRGEKRMRREQRRGHYHVMECAYGSFQRAVPLPAEVDMDGASAKYRNGVLLVTLPKTRQERRRRVTVQVG